MNSCKFKAGNAAYRNKLSSCLWLYHKWQRIHPLLCIQYPANVSEEFFAVFQQKKIQNPKTKLNTVRNRSYLFAEIRPPRTAVQSFSETKLSTSQTQSYIFFTSLNFTTKYSRFCMSIFSSRHFGFGAYSHRIRDMLQRAFVSFWMVLSFFYQYNFRWKATQEKSETHKYVCDNTCAVHEWSQVSNIFMFHFI